MVFFFGWLQGLFLGWSGLIVEPREMQLDGTTPTHITYFESRARVSLLGDSTAQHWPG